MCNSDRVEEKTARGEVPNNPNNNCWHSFKDGPKFKYRKLVNLKHIWVNISRIISIETVSSLPVISITSDEIWFLNL